MTPGTFALDPIELQYTPRFESAPVASRVTGPTVNVSSSTILGLSPKYFVVILTIVGIFGFLVIYLVRRHRKNLSKQIVVKESYYERLKSNFAMTYS